MAGWGDDVRKDYEDLKSRFRKNSVDDLKSGDWFADFVQWILSEYSQTVDAEYIRKKYPGASPANQARKLISLAARYNAMAGGLSASAISALELSSLGPQALVTVPAAGSLIVADIAYSSRTQLRATYDLSVIHKAPLSLDDADDCYLIFLTAMGVKVQELIGGAGKAIGPRIVAYNVRKLLRAGLRKSLQDALQRIGGVQLARILSERAMMRLLVPGVNIPIASGFNYYFTRQLLNVAQNQMARRGAVVQPIVRLYAREPRLSKTFGPKVLIAIADLGGTNGVWCEAQMEALRHCQSALSLSDEDLTNLDGYFDRSVSDVIKELPDEFANGADDLLELAVVQAAFAEDDRHDAAYAEGVAALSLACGTHMSSDTALNKIKTTRRRLL